MVWELFPHICILWKAGHVALANEMARCDEKQHVRHREAAMSDHIESAARDQEHLRLG